MLVNYTFFFNYRMSVNQENSVLCALECPVCRDHMPPPIRQCLGGHSICQSCFQKVEFCPVCRSHKDPISRSWALEKIYESIQIPCKNAYAGCLVSREGLAIRKHQDECNYKTRICPFKDYEACSWNNLTSKLEAHLELSHARNFYKGSGQMFVVQNFKGRDTSLNIYSVISAYNQFFRISWELDELTG